MASFRRILCATDLSEAGDVAIVEADRHARAHGAELFLLHVMPNRFAGVPMTPQATEELLIQHGRLGARINEELVTRAVRLTNRRAEEMTTFVEDGQPAVEIVRKAQELAADLVVLSSTGTTGWRRLVMGGVATRVIRTAHTSVLVARPRPGSDRIVVGTDLSELARAALVLAAEEGRRFQAKVFAVHAVEWLTPDFVMATSAEVPAPMVPPRTLEEMRSASARLLEEELAATQVVAEPRLMEGPAAKVLVHVAEEASADLVVVASLGRSGIDRVLLGSVAETVARDAPSSVLIVRPA